MFLFALWLCPAPLKVAQHCRLNWNHKVCSCVLIVIFLCANLFPCQAVFALEPCDNVAPLPWLKMVGLTPRRFMPSGEAKRQQKKKNEQDAAVVIVRNPKNRRFLGRQQFVLIEDWSTILWLAWWVNGLKIEDKLFPGGRYCLLELFYSVLTTLHLSGMGFTLASFRTSGATFLFRSHGNLGKLQYHGRWCSLNSLQHYLQEAMSALLASQVPEQAKAILTALNNSTAVGMNPPACAPNHQLRHGRSDSTARGPDPRSAWPTVSSRRRRRPRKER